VHLIGTDVQPILHDRLGHPSLRLVEQARCINGLKAEILIAVLWLTSSSPANTAVIDGLFCT
jgi:hypothetical protein